MTKEKYNVTKNNGRYYPERYDKDLGWVGYKYYSDFLSFDNEDDAWKHINSNPNNLNINCD